ncbi:MAG: efflux RND transporter periplasmic adaptor subunit [Actinophytocola sp.]|uniref:efflux RND transporter periplasmic adaptor subunit n=1 Tax=Actinophytocola sp. TaxID=1872138 RepID=UPI00132B4796|nr:efflux RND transporter periplasmic adaptor subunit [Actinophytocola sp.]MPZ86083.1 efflux RND transporter periplasmic adaptor subunit [Actinophytocola sp.]
MASAVVMVAVITSCSTGEPEAQTPDLAPRGTAMTTVTPSRQDLTNTVSLSGTVTMDPVYGIVAPVAGQVRYLTIEEPDRTPTRPTRVGSVWADGEPHWFEVPAGSTFTGRLADDRATVTAGMPVASAKLAGYAIVAEIDGEQAYQIAAGLTQVQAQIKNGPGPFPCKALGTIAALPEGTVPAPPPAEPPAEPESPRSGAQPPPVEPVDQEPPAGGPGGSDSTGLRLVCTAPPATKLINGASVDLEVVTAKAANALVVPVEAVAGKQGSGKVDVVESDGGRKIVDVVLGLTDGKVIEVKSGLKGDETLSVPGPNLPSGPDPQQGGDPSGPMGSK